MNCVAMCYVICLYNDSKSLGYNVSKSLARMVLLGVVSYLDITTFSVTNGFVRCYVISSYNDFQCHELLLGATAAVHATPAGGEGCG